MERIDRRRVFYTEAAYLAGLLLLAVGTALMEKADMGVSMVVAPAYLTYLKVSQYLPFFSFGMAEYLLQAALLVAMMLLLREFRWSYLCAILTAALYGLVLDGAMQLIRALPDDVLFLRLTAYYAGGMLLCCLGVAFMFKTYLTPEAYELFVKRVSAKWGFSLPKFKTCYDLASCGVGILLSFLFFGFGRFEGIRWGTVFCSLVNGFLIGRWTWVLDRLFRFKDRWPLRRHFE